MHRVRRVYEKERKPIGVEVLIMALYSSTPPTRSGSLSSSKIKGVYLTYVRTEPLPPLTEEEKQERRDYHNRLYNEHCKRLKNNE